MDTQTNDKVVQKNPELTKMQENYHFKGMGTGKNKISSQRICPSHVWTTTIKIAH